LGGRDLYHKDKENFSAVLSIVRAAPLLQEIPDVVATKQFVDTIQCVVDSYLIKNWNLSIGLKRYGMPHALYVIGVSGFFYIHILLCKRMLSQAMLTCALS